MTAVNRSNSISADPAKASRTESDDREMLDGYCLIELDTTELSFVGGGNGIRPRIEG